MDSSVKYQNFSLTQEDGGDKKSAKKPDPSSVCLVVFLWILIIFSLAVLCTAIGVGVFLSHSKSDNQPPPSGLSSDTTVTQEQLQGEYYGTDGGIRFTSTVNATYAVLSITTTSGEYVVYIIHPLASNMTMMGVNDTDFLLLENDQQVRIDYNDYVIPRDAKNLMESIIFGNEKMTDDMLRQLDNKTVNETRQSVLYNLAMSYEAALIIEAAQALGDRGIMGMDYPSVMTFYQFALRLASNRGISSTTVYKAKDSFTSDSKKGYQHRQRRDVVCDNGATCSSNRCPFRKYDNDCFGMCGPGCRCWERVCGDCCVHQYCLTHDQCCADVGFYTVTCFSVAVRKPFASCSDTFRC